MNFNTFAVDRHLIVPLQKACEELSVGLNRNADNDAQLLQVLNRWKSQIGEGIQRIKTNTSSNPQLHAYVVLRGESIMGNIRLCLSLLQDRENSITGRRLPRGEMAPDGRYVALLNEIGAVKDTLQEAKAIFPLEEAAPPPAKNENRTNSRPVTKVTIATVAQCISDVFFGLPVRQLISETACSLTWCIRKWWDFALMCATWNILKGVRAFIPIAIATLGWCAISIPMSIMKKICVDIPSAFIGIFKPSVWLKIVPDPRDPSKEVVISRCAESSAWLENGWFNLSFWVEKWVEWVFSD